MSTKELLERAQAHVDRVYTSHADARQKEMGLAYVTAERVDLAREFARFASAEVYKAEDDKYRAGQKRARRGY